MIAYRNIAKPLIVSLLMLSVAGCGNRETANTKTIQTGVPVSLTKVITEPLFEYIELNAISGFRKKHTIRSVVAGMIEQVNVNAGDKVKKGQLLFSIKTKEAAAVTLKENTVDSSLSFKGLINILSSKDGIICSVAHQKGDYVMEGDELSSMADIGSLVFFLQFPYELISVLKLNQTCDLISPDGEIIKGKILSELPVMDALSQTAGVVVKPLKECFFPENLILTARIVKKYRQQAHTLPKTAVLSDETQSSFWVMKLINDSTAVKVVVEKGLVSGDKIEILSPLFSPSDRIILNGDYGLEDTARVKIN